MTQKLEKVEKKHKKTWQAGEICARLRSSDERRGEEGEKRKKGERKSEWAGVAAAAYTKH